MKDLRRTRPGVAPLGGLGRKAERNGTLTLLLHDVCIALKHFTHFGPFRAPIKPWEVRNRCIKYRLVVRGIIVLTSAVLLSVRSGYGESRGHLYPHIHVFGERAYGIIDYIQRY